MINWTHYDTLVAYLQDLIVRAPSDFDYLEGDAETHGCVDCYCRILGDYSYEAFGNWAGGLAIEMFLDIPRDEARGLWRPAAVVEDGLPFAGGSGEMKGVPGIREALRRLAILATRYERPAEAEPVTADPMPASLRQTLDRLTRGETVTP